MNLVKIVVFALLIHGPVQNAWATNLWFMPGDACFPAILDTQMLEDVRDSNHNMHLNFRSLRGGGYFCGYAGYNSIEIQDAPQFWSESLHEIYKDLRSQSPRRVTQEFNEEGKVERETETNGFLMFVQNRTFEVDKFQVGFRYNENWMDAFPAKENSSTSITHLYQPNFRSAEDVTEDWANGKRVDGLKVRFPEPEKEEGNEFSRRFGKGPLIGSAKDLMLVILPYENLELHLSREKRRDSESVVAERRREDRLITVDAEEVRVHQRNKNGKHRSIPWKRGLKVNESSVEE